VIQLPPRGIAKSVKEARVNARIEKLVIKGYSDDQISVKVRVWPLQIARVRHKVWLEELAGK
jgi:hypothetical protein